MPTAANHLDAMGVRCLERRVADLSDVETALVAVILAAAQAGSAELPLLGGSPVRVYRGTPPTAAMTADRAAGIVNISVLAVPNTTRNTTRWNMQSATASVSAGLSASVIGQTASFSGVAVAGELAGLLIDEQAFVYRAQAGDEAGLVAAALADLVRAVRSCWLQQASVSVPGAIQLVARTAGVATVVQEWSRQEQAFRIAVRAPSPQVRDAVCATLGVALSEIAFLTLSDGTAGRLRYTSTDSTDDEQVASIYQRGLVFDVEYGTTLMQMAPVMLFGDLNYDGTTLYG